MSKPSILLAMPQDNQIIDLFVANLHFHGFNVHLPQDFFQANNNSLLDYGLIIRPDIFIPEFITALKHRLKYRAAYQWDGLMRYPRIFQLMGEFDRFFCFNPIDYAYLKLQNNPLYQPTTNFYLDFDLETTYTEETDFHFIGTQFSERAQLLINFAKTALYNHCSIDFTVVCRENEDATFLKQNYEQAGIKVIYNSISAPDVRLATRKAKVLVDFLNPVHRGLSFRTFDALGFKKKLITTNPDIIHYDFFHPNNIFLLTEQNIQEVGEFLAKPYVEIDENIRQKYSFGNWIRYMLNIHPHQPISLPLAHLGKNLN